MSVRRGLGLSFVANHQSSCFSFIDYRQRVRFTQETRKTQENIFVSDISDWTFANKGNEQLKCSSGKKTSR
jgi:hypothetical protein